MTSRMIAGLVLLVGVSSAGASETALDRGAYLVNAVAACANCHTPKKKSELNAPLSGGTAFGAGPASVVAPNITPDKATGIGAWSDAEIIDAIRDGVRPDGSHLRPPMPQQAYSGMTDQDVRAVVAYLRSVPPATHVVSRAPQTEHAGGPARPAVHAAVSPPSEDIVSRGRYIANSLSHCTECHTPGPASGAPDFAHHLDEGGRVFRTATGPVVAPDITAPSLTRFTDTALATLITTGVRPDGSILHGPMPVAAYAGLRSDDVAALIAYLRTPQSAAN